MAKNLILGPIWARLAEIWAPKTFLWVLPQLDVRHCRRLTSHAISRKTNDPNSRKGQNISFWACFRPLEPKFGLPNFLKKLWLCQSLDTMVSYHHVQYQKKLMIQSRVNLVTNGQTGIQTDGRERFHRPMFD